MRPRPSLKALETGAFPPQEVERFTVGRAVPSHFYRRDLSGTAWQALSPQERLDKMNEGLRRMPKPIKAALLAEHRRRTAQVDETPGDDHRATRPPASPPAPSWSGSHVVVCSGGCGTYVDAPSPTRPARRYCPPCQEKGYGRARRRRARHADEHADQDA